MMIFESHAHYDDEAFDGDRDELLDGLNSQGIGYVINVGSDMQSLERTLELTGKYPFMYGALGIHPSEAGELTEAGLKWIRARCLSEQVGKGDGKIVAVGEIGLDYYWDVPDRDVQKRWFERQLELAREVELPVIVHSRDAASDTLGIMKSCRAGDIGGVVHCFSYSSETAREFLEMGFYIGVGGVVTFSNARKLKEVISFIPVERILLETDAPYLAPVPYRGKRNSSLNLTFIAQEIASIKGISYEEVVRVTGENAGSLFKVSGE